MKIENYPLAEIIPYGNNCRHNEDAVKSVCASLQEFGWVQPIVCDENLVIIAGHTRLKSAYKLGYKTAPVFIAKGLSEDRVRFLRLHDNNIRSAWDFKKLEMEVKTFNLDKAFNFEKFDFNPFDGVEQKEEVEEVEGENDIPEIKESVCKLGDLWTLEKHRVLCGDSTKIEDVERLMNGEKADFGFCDPPYNLGFKYNSYDDNKTKEEYSDFSRLWFSNLQDHTDRQSITLGTKNIPLMSLLGDVAGVACWVKKNWITSCHISKLQQWEPIFFYGDYTKLKRNSDLYEINRKVQKDVGDSHSCPKQIELIQEIFLNYSISSVLDLFLGSGTSLIACEKTNRKCYGMELDEHYISVILKRWADFTGKDPVRDDGVKFSELLTKEGGEA